MIPKGKLLIVGGHEDKGAPSGENLTIHQKKRSQSHFEILGTLISRIPRAHHIIEIIASASSIPDEMEALYIDSFRQEGFTQVGIIKVHTREDAVNPECIRRARGAHAVFFTGGDQNKLVELLADSDLIRSIRKKYMNDEHFIVAGTSAGAMAMPETMIGGGLIREALFKKDIKLANGFNFISDVLVDTHFIKRGRIARLTHAVLLNPTSLGIGLGEDTALLISAGNHAECIGSGMVILIDGSKNVSTNVETVDDLTPIVASNVMMHILAEGSIYLIKEGKCLVQDAER